MVPDSSDRSLGSREEPLASVIIPANNEAGTITRTLDALTGEARGGEFDIVVVCNGCTDETAKLARSVPGVRVVEIAPASKIAALREGDHSSDVFPRIYLDGDVVLSTKAARALAEALATGEALVAGIPGRYVLDDVPLSVQLFYEFRQRLPVFADGIIGAGVYALSAEGRARFGEWPEVLGDDQFVFRLFDTKDRAVLRAHHTLVEPAPDLRTVVRRGMRVRRGNRELTDGVAGSPPLPPPSAGIGAALRESLRNPRGWLSAAVFAAVMLAIRARSRFAVRFDWS